MVYYKTDQEIEQLRKSNILVSKTLAYIGSLLKIGVNPKFLDAKAEEFIRDNKGRPAFKGYRGFPASLCISINEVVVHGIPGNYEIKSEDIISVDCGIALEGYYGDAAFTFAMAEVSDDVCHLLKVTEESLYRGIENAVSGKRLGDIGYAIQRHVEQHNYSVVRDLVGHGIGKSLHEEPNVPNYGRQGNGMLLKEGLVLAIEPMINQGTKRVFTESDNWTVKTKDLKPSAHFEHSVAVKKFKADILSDHSFIKEAIKNNKEIREIV